MAPFIGAFRAGHLPSRAALVVVAIAAWLGAMGLHAAPIDPAVLPLLKRSFLHGREYFILRSGRAKLLVQADRVDLAPAFLYLIFDAEDNRQSGRKETALNFGDGQGFVNSALEVVLGDFPFTAIGHQTQTRWTTVDGIPAIEAVWWAGGLRVTEWIFALAEPGAFVRRIELTSANLAGGEAPKLRLSLPPGPCTVRDGRLVQETAARRITLASVGPWAAHPIVEQGVLEIGPESIAPGQSKTIDTVLLASIPPRSEPDGTFDLPGLLDKTRAGWTIAASISTEDGTVQELFDKARFGLSGMIADNGVMDAGIFEYGSQWVRDTSNTLLGLIHVGQFELARGGFNNILEHMITAEGNAMIAGSFADPDKEQFDQMGELMHALKAYRDWTGDDSLLRQHRQKLIALVERPLRSEFRDETGMVRNRREFWERTLGDAYELAYQTYVIVGLRDAAALAGPLDADDRAARWRAEADRLEHAMLHHPTRALVENGRLIKRRSTSGERVTTIVFPAAADDVPLKTESVHESEPDATMALPIALGVVDAHSPLARQTLDELEKLRGARWFGGGYERYHSSGQCDQPGPWPFASCFILRAQHDAGLFDRSRDTLEWLNTVQGGRTGCWFEEIPLVRSQAPTAGVVPWTSGEIALFVARHLLGVRFEGSSLVLRPSLFPGSPAVRADFRFRQSRLRVEIPSAGPVAFAEVHGQRMMPDETGAIRLPPDFAGGSIVFHVDQRSTP